MELIYLKEDPLIQTKFYDSNNVIRQRNHTLM